MTQDRSQEPLGDYEAQIVNFLPSSTYDSVGCLRTWNVNFIKCRLHDEKLDIKNISSAQRMKKPKQTNEFGARLSSTIVSPHV